MEARCRPHGFDGRGEIVNHPEFALANTRGEYIIEGCGIDADIGVENDSKSVIAGREPQLERAVDEAKKISSARPDFQNAGRI